MSNSVSDWLITGQWKKDLRAAGFVRDNGTRDFVREGVTFAIEDNWPVLWAAGGEGPADLLTGQLGQPGLWKWVFDQGEVLRHFELPPAAFDGLDPVDETGEQWSPFSAFLTWALATLDGSGLDEWSPPPKEEVAAFIPPSSLTVQHGAYICQGMLDCEPRRMALRIPIVTSIPDDLSQERSSWLRCLLMAANNRWRLIRIGFAEGPAGLMVCAEVDLTGVPRPLLKTMVAIALPALRNVAEWVVCSTVFLTVSRNGCRALAEGAARPEDQPLWGKGGECE